MEFEQLKKEAIKFRDERDWKQFHTPKNLAEGLIIEAAELLENFLWLENKESRKLDEKRMKMIREEIGDVFLFTIFLCDELGIDVFKAAADKLELTKKKYPAEKCKGSAKKYTEYQKEQ